MLNVFSMTSHVTVLSVIAFFSSDTCRCQKRLASNYRTFPPYVDQFEVSGDGRITVENMTGMLPKILDDLVVTCCQTCGAHGRSYVDFKYNGTNGTAKQNSEKEMKFLIQDRNDLRSVVKLSLCSFSLVILENFLWLASKLIVSKSMVSSKER